MRRLFLGCLLLGVLVAAAPAKADEQICPDGRRSYFGVCPTGAPAPQTPQSGTVSAEEALRRGRSAQAARDYAGALNWYRQAADAGNAEAMDAIAVLYMYGIGVTKDGAEAMRWAQRSSDLGNEDAVLNVGIMNAAGAPGVAQNCAEGVRLVQKTADDNYVFGMQWFGSMYDRGLCVPHDLVAARAWMIKAAQKGDPDAKKWLTDHPQ